MSQSLPRATSYFLGGYHWDNESQLDRFIKNGIWENGYEKKYINIVQSVKPNDVVFLKTKSIKGGNNLILKAAGIVEENIGDGRSLKIQWRIVPGKYEASIESLGANYPGTFHKVKESHLQKIFDGFGSDFLVQRLFTSAWQETLIEYLHPQFRISGDVLESSFDLEVVAEIYGSLIHRSVSNPISIDNTSQEDRFFGIFGQWGRGKTRLWKEVKKHLEEEYPSEYKFLDFHAWKYQESASIWAYLYETFSDKYYFKSNSAQLFKYLSESFVNGIQSIWLNLYRDPKALFGSLIGIIGFILTLAYHEAFNSFTLQSFLFGSLALGSIILGIKGFFESISKPLQSSLKSFKSLKKRKHFKEQLGLQHETQEELKYLFKAWKTKKTFILFIDDLDRCELNKIINVVDAIRVMLNDFEIQKKLVVVLAVDERIIHEAILQKYKSFNSRSESNNFRLATEYMDKLFICGLKLEELSANDNSEFVQKMISNMVEDVHAAEREESEELRKKEGLIDDDFYLKDSEGRSFTKMYFNVSTVELEGQLTQEDANSLIEQSKKISNSTPRLLRNYLYRFLLARQLISQLSNFDDELRSAWLDGRDEICQTIIDGIVNNLNGKSNQIKDSSSINLLADRILTMVNYSMINLENIDDNDKN